MWTCSILYSNIAYFTPARLAICVRVTIALFSVTYFQPDEYFQALEPAHDLVFGYGRLTWEWRVNPPIRSVFFPMLFAPVYWVLKVASLDGSDMLIWAPKIVQGLFASITDIAICRLARNVLGERYVPTAFILSLTSLFHLQALSRTLSNSLETSLTTLALSDWPFSTVNSSQQLIKPIIVAALACMIRPTNAIIWSFLVLELSWRIRHDLGHVWRVWIQLFAVGMVACVTQFLLDSWYFGNATFTSLNFFLMNMSPVSTFYGRNSWHYYLTQGIPVLCNVVSPWFIYGMWCVLWTGMPPVRRLASLIVWTMFVYSLAAHKEWRFMHPLLPAMHVLSSKTLVDTKEDLPNNTNRKIWYITTIMISTIAPYLLFVQSRAQIAVMHRLRSVPVNELHSVGFLTPCHSTPWQSHLHRPHLTDNLLWALGCEPPIGGQSLNEYQDQSDVFYATPIAYLRTRFPNTVDPHFPPSQFPASIPGSRGATNETWVHSWPSHLVFFGSLLESDGVQALLEALGYQQIWNGWNGWEQDKRRRGGVRLWAWQSHGTRTLLLPTPVSRR
ncbi:glycosyltransferase family 22 protein [Ramaria rubella]|nr:glycosyltransferase family 22 protein [Ramaria rubella]